MYRFEGDCHRFFCRCSLHNRFHPQFAVLEDLLNHICLIFFPKKGYYPHQPSTFLAFQRVNFIDLIYCQNASKLTVIPYFSPQLRLSSSGYINGIFCQNLLLINYLCRKMAEREGFEPSVELPLHSISNAAPSTTRPPLRFVRNSKEKI